MVVTYAQGYKGDRKTVDQLELVWGWTNLHPEFRKRLIGLFDYARAFGTDVGIGGGARSRSAQLGVFLQRHHQVASGGCCVFEGRRYALNDGAAHAAPPDKSYHETGVVGIYATAADLVGDLKFVAKVAGQFGLTEFTSLKEPWHVQPAEFPRSRSHYTGTPLKVWLCPVRRKTLRKGNVSADVSVLKRALNVVNNAKLPNTMRAFGAGCDTALRAYQAQYGLPVTGVCDDTVWESLYRVANLKGVKF